MKQALLQLPERSIWLSRPGTLEHEPFVWPAACMSITSNLHAGLQRHVPLPSSTHREPGCLSENATANDLDHFPGFALTAVFPAVHRI